MKETYKIDSIITGDTIINGSINLELEPEQLEAINNFCAAIGIALSVENIGINAAIEAYEKEEKFLFHIFMQFKDGMFRGQCYAYLTEREYETFRSLTYDLMRKFVNSDKDHPQFDFLRIPSNRIDSAIASARFIGEKVIESDTGRNNFKTIYSLFRCDYYENREYGYANMGNGIVLRDYEHVIDKFKRILDALANYDDANRGVINFDCHIDRG